MRGARGIFGNLYLTEKIGSNEFTDDDQHIAELLAAMTAAAVDNARLHEESAHLLTEVHQLQRTRERFFAMVNHELRNALAAVLGWSELLVRKKDPATLPRAAFEVHDSAEQAVALISDLLDLSRLDENRLKPVFRLVDPGLLVHRAISRVMPAAEAKEIRIHVNASPGLAPIETDASRVEQILVNLLTNAVKYSPIATDITVMAAQASGRHCFQVEDAGPGVRPENAEMIFDIYVTSVEGEKQGIGLGLPLSRRLARLLGGELQVVPHVGAGIFILDLPIVQSS